MLIVDAHLDLAWNALQWNRDLLCSVYTIRTQESRTPGQGRATGTVAFPIRRAWAHEQRDSANDDRMGLVRTARAKRTHGLHQA